MSPPEVAELWNRTVPAKYRLDQDLIRHNLIDHPLLHSEASSLDVDAFVAVKRSANGLYEGPDAKVAHLSLFAQTAGFGPYPDASPLRRAIAVLREEGYQALVVGTDIDHFLPGAPTDIPWMGSFLAAHGYVRGGLQFDLERDLTDFAAAPVAPGAVYRTVTEADLPALDDFFRREFSQRWAYDVRRKIAAEGASTVFGLFIGATCEGFALIQQEGCRLPIGGAAWKADLGTHWGSLGPIGVSASLRGQGRGHELLNQALFELKSRGCRRTIIDWTGLVDFYGTQGFSVNRSYRSYRLDLAADPPPSA